AASASASWLRAHWCRTPAWCCSTSPSRAWTPAARRFWQHWSTASPPGAAACSWRRMTWIRRADSIACSASTVARSPSAAPRCSRARCWRRPTAARSSRCPRAPTGGRRAESSRRITTSTAMTMTDAWNWLSEPWGQAFMQHAFTEVVLVGLLGGWLGCWVLLYGVSYSAESLSHGMFPGLVGASLLGLPLIAGGAVGAGAAAAGIAGLGSARGIDRDTSVGVVVTSLFGLGALLAL